MSEFAVTFVILPCVAACILAVVIRDWRLAAAALCGALALVFIRDVMPVGVGIFVLPVIFGFALGAAALIVALLWRPTLDIWGRMLAALGLTFFVSVSQLLIITTGF